MNILVVGCGILGSNLCNALSSLGHEISVIAESHDEFSALSPDFRGYTTVGVAVDMDVLRAAGIENCDAVAAVTADDNVNLMVVQIAKQFFGINEAYARVNDPTKSEVFTKIGPKTICPTNTTVETFISSLTAQGDFKNVILNGHSIIISRIEAEKRMIGHRLSDLSLEQNETIIAIEHENSSIRGVFLSNYEIAKGDSLICAKFVE
ncbi:MAG: potassium channel family protein [Oscillospiraceae bacterium]